MADRLLDVRGLFVSYAGAVKALRGVSLSVPEGAIVAVLGNNGAGKSTLLRAISGTLLEPSEARSMRVTIDVRRPGGRRQRSRPTIVRAGVVQVPEGRRIFADLTVEENLRAGGLAARDRDARAEARARVHRAVPASCANAAPSAPACCPAASSRCSRSAAR